MSLNDGHVKTVKAVRYHGQRDLRVEDLPVSTAPLKEGQIRLRTAWCGICGTDVHEYLHGPVSRCSNIPNGHGLNVHQRCFHQQSKSLIRSQVSTCPSLSVMSSLEW